MAGAMMAYSSRAHRFVLFGGWDGVAGLNGTWVYDPGMRTWNELHPDVSPLGRGDARVNLGAGGAGGDPGRPRSGTHDHFA